MPQLAGLLGSAGAAIGAGASAVAAGAATAGGAVATAGKAAASAAAPVLKAFGGDAGGEVGIKGALNVVKSVSDANPVAAAAPAEGGSAGQRQIAQIEAGGLSAPAGPSGDNQELLDIIEQILSGAR